MRNYIVYGLKECSEYEQRKFGQIVKAKHGFAATVSEDAVSLRCTEETAGTLEFLFGVRCEMI